MNSILVYSGKYLGALTVLFLTAGLTQAQDICSKPGIILCEDFEWSDDPNYYSGGDQNTEDWQANGWERFGSDFSNYPQPNGVKAGVGFGGSNGVVIFQPANKKVSSGIYPTHFIAEPGEGYEELYVQWKTKWSKNFAWDNITVKNFYIKSFDKDRMMDWRVPLFINGKAKPVPELYGPLTGWYSNQYNRGPIDRYLSSNRTDIRYLNQELDKWHTIEFYVKIETEKSGPGKEANGIFKMWDNGVLIMEHYDVQFRNKDSKVPMNAVWISPYWGGSGEESHPDQYVWYDDIIVSTSYIGVEDEVHPRAPAPLITTN